MAKPVPTDSPILTVRQVAARLQVGTKSVYALIRRGHLHAALIGHQYRVTPEALAELFGARRLVRRRAGKPRSPRRARHG